MGRSFLVALFLLLAPIAASATPITINLTSWSFSVDNAALPESRFQFNITGVDSSGNAFSFSGFGQGTAPRTDQTSGLGLVGGFQLQYGSLNLSATGNCCVIPGVIEPSVRGQINFAPNPPGSGGDPRNINSVLSFTSPPGLIIWSGISDTQRLVQLGILTFNLGGAATVTGVNDNSFRLVTSGKGGTATLDLTQTDVPEPATLLLLGLGLAAFAIKIRR